MDLHKSEYFKVITCHFFSQDDKKAPSPSDDATLSQAAPEVVSKVMMWDLMVIN